AWYTRWADEFDARELEQGFWQWRTRFTSLTSLDWLRDSDEPLYNVMYEIRFIVRENPVYVREAERWQVPNKLTNRRPGRLP
ncbi:plasmid SOS inhibition protein A, partial [Salmonella enterica]